MAKALKTELMTTLAEVIVIVHLCLREKKKVWKKERKQEKQAGAEPCQAQVKLGLARLNNKLFPVNRYN